MNKQDFINFKFPPLDAEDFFNDTNALENLFFKSDENYKKLLEPTTCFLVGTKGSGKTMYAAYVCKCETSVTADYYPIRYEDYAKFLNAIKDNKIRDTDIQTIWKAILIVKILSNFDANEIDNYFINKIKVITTIKHLQKVDIVHNIVSDGFYPAKNSQSYTTSKGHSIKADVGAEKAEIAAKSDITTETIYTKKFDSLEYFDSWGEFISDVRSCLSKVKLKKPHFLFVDGIDIRPNDLEYKEYLNCVSSLIRASYELNQDIFASCKFKIVVLTRPDILNISGLHNLECILEDKSIVLNWNNYNSNDIETSDMYSLINQILKNIYTSGAHYDVWEDDFNFLIQPLGSFYRYKSFEYCMRMTSARPRNFIKLLSELQSQARRDKKTTNSG